MSTAHAGCGAKVSAVGIVPYWKKGRQFKTMFVQKNIDMVKYKVFRAVKGILDMLNLRRILPVNVEYEFFQYK